MTQINSDESANRRTPERAPLPTRAQCVVNGSLCSLIVDDVSEGGLRLQGVEDLPSEALIKIFLPIRRAGKRR